MNNINKIAKDQFLYPIARYNNRDSEGNSIFNTKLQQFSAKVNFISSLHTNGKLSSQQVCEQLQQLLQVFDE